MKTKTTIPVIANVDVVVVGGASGGVAAAASAARSGSRVFLAAAESYLGEDICATGSLWLSPDEPLTTALAQRLFTDAAGARVVPVNPIDIKRELDGELLDAGVQFLFGCAPSDLLVDPRGRVAGVVLASRTGLFAVTARAVIDTTPQALLARLAGVSFTEWDGGRVAFKRVVIGARSERDDGSIGRLLPGLVRGEHDRKPVELEAFEYSVDLPIRAWTTADLAEAEQSVRDLTWHKDQTWGADRLWCVPPVSVAAARGPVETVDGKLPLEAFATTRERLFVLGPCAAVSRATAESLLRAPYAIQAGDQLGVHAAEVAKELPVAKTVRSLRGPVDNPAVRESCTCSRFLREHKTVIKGGAGGALPVLGEVDVVVVGGGTGGAPAAIAAARAGARVLLLESLHGLGGTGTLGNISFYYYGYRDGFTAEITEAMRKIAGDAGFNPVGWNTEHKAEWFRAELRKAGGQIWFGSLVSGAMISGKKVEGVVVNTPWARGVIKATVVIDSTGNSDVAAAAGADCKIVSESDLAIQGSGLPLRPIRPAYYNTDYTFIDDGDPVDVTRAFVVARRKYTKAFDLASITHTRERRQIVGDVTVTPLDVYTGRTWRDTICLSRSNFDSHGFTVHPIFLIEPPDHTSLDAWLPLRALLPKGMEGVLVTGLGLSGQRDVMPVLRMQPDIQNHAYAAGLAASMAVKSTGGRIRDVDVKTLQRRLAEIKIVPQTVLLHEDGKRLARSLLVQSARGELRAYTEIAALMTQPREAVALLRERLVSEKATEQRIQCAKLLAVLGDASGEADLIQSVSVPEWDKGWNYTGMGQFGRSLSPIDDCIVCLGLLKSQAAREAVRAKVVALDVSQAFSHFRAVSLYAESVEGLASELAGALNKPGISGHAWGSVIEELGDIPESTTDTRTRNEALKELYLARALFRNGDPSGVATLLLQAYSRDIRGHFARHAAMVLSQPPVAK